MSCIYRERRDKKILHGFACLVFALVVWPSLGRLAPGRSPVEDYMRALPTDLASHSCVTSRILGLGCAPALSGIPSPASQSRGVHLRQLRRDTAPHAFATVAPLGPTRGCFTVLPTTRTARTPTRCESRYSGAMTTTEFIHEALALSREERADLAMRLLDSLDGSDVALEHDAAWEAEIVRRLDAVRDGHASTVPARQAIEDLRRQRRARS